MLGTLKCLDDYDCSPSEHFRVDCSQSMNIQSSRGFLQVVDVVPPLCRQVLLVLSTIDDSAQYRVSNSLKVILPLYYVCFLPLFVFFSDPCPSFKVSSTRNVVRSCHFGTKRSTLSSVEHVFF